MPTCRPSLQTCLVSAPSQPSESAPTVSSIPTDNRAEPDGRHKECCRGWQILTSQPALSLCTSCGGAALLQAASFNASAMCAGLACRWAGSHLSEDNLRQPQSTRIANDAPRNLQQADTASLRGSSLEVSCTGSGITGAGTAVLALTA